MSEPLAVEGVERTSEEKRSHEENDVARNRGGGGSLFGLLSSDYLLLVFQWIGLDNLKVYDHLASIDDPVLTHFIYTECTYLWRHIDLAMFPGITDPQLQSLLERIDALSVTESITFDKNPSSPITGVGLEPLRHSRVLESIDLRQSEATSGGPTGLDDDLVSDILSTMLPHKLTIVKIRKKYGACELLCDQYCFSWASFFTNLRVSQARKCATKCCTHCSESLFREGRDSMQYALHRYTAQCDACKGYSCRPWNPDTSVCPRIEECQHCRNGFARVVKQSRAITATRSVAQTVKRTF